MFFTGFDNDDLLYIFMCFEGKQLLFFGKRSAMDSVKNIKI